MKHLIILFFAFFIAPSLYAQVVIGGTQSTADWDFDCSENRVKIEISRRGSNFFFTTTGFTTAATAQYYFTTCITSVTTFGADGIFAIVSAPYLREEIAQGGGEHLQAWFQMIEIPPKNHHATVLLLKQKYSTLDPNNALKFAQQIHKIVYDFNQFPLHKRIIFKRS